MLSTNDLSQVNNYLPIIIPNNIGDGTNAHKLIIVRLKPIATALSFSSTLLTSKIFNYYQP